MYKLSLAALIVATLTTTAWGQIAQPTPCGQPWQTLLPAGTADSFAIAGLTCTPVRGSTKGNCATLAGATAKTANMACQWITSKSGYRCCFEKVQSTYATAGPGSTLATIGPGSTQFPQFLKPKCPVGALASITPGSNEVKPCNMTKGTNQNCPSGFTCRQAINVNDVYGTLADPSDDLGAAFTPHVCCRSDTLTSTTAAWKDVTVIPESMYPSAAIVSMKLTGGYAYLNDDFSGLSNQLMPFTTEINLATATDAAKFYHVFMFDSTTNKECVFIPNTAGTGTTKLTLAATLAKTSVTPIKTTMVYNAGPAGAPVYKWMDGYALVAADVNAFGKFNANLTPKRWVVLVWQTDALITFAAAGVRSTTQLNLLGGTNGDFQPTTSTPAGLYVNATNTLINRIGLSTILGKPGWGMYFTATN